MGTHKQSGRDKIVVVLLSTCRPLKRAITIIMGCDLGDSQTARLPRRMAILTPLIPPPSLAPVIHQQASSLAGPPSSSCPQRKHGKALLAASLVCAGGGKVLGMQLFQTQRYEAQVTVLLDAWAAQDLKLGLCYDFGE